MAIVSVQDARRCSITRKVLSVRQKHKSSSLRMSCLTSKLHHTRKHSKESADQGKKMEFQIRERPHLKKHDLCLNMNPPPIMKLDIGIREGTPPPGFHFRREGDVVGICFWRCCGVLLLCLLVALCSPCLGLVVVVMVMVWLAWWMVVCGLLLAPAVAPHALRSSDCQ